jgi:hypothetical protein
VFATASKAIDREAAEATPHDSCDQLEARQVPPLGHERYRAIISEQASNALSAPTS